MIKRITPLLIGELQAGAVINDADVTYIAIARLTSDDPENSIGIDEIEARALCAWLAMSLGFTLTQPGDPT